MSSDAKISHKGLEWHFQHILDEARHQLNFTSASLKESRDFQGNPHKVWVEAVSENMRKHFDEAEQFMRQQKE
jgi:hypothetical protein